MRRKSLRYQPELCPAGTASILAPSSFLATPNLQDQPHKFIAAQMIPTRTTGDLLAGVWSLLSGQLGRFN